jgi:hypothetical protein
MDIHNLPTWVKGLDDRLAKVLASRLFKALENRNYTFRTIVENGEDEEKQQKQHQYAAIQMQPISIEILLRNQEISSVPAVPTARSLFFDRLHDYIGVVCNL